MSECESCYCVIRLFFYHCLSSISSSKSNISVRFCFCWRVSVNSLVRTNVHLFAITEMIKGNAFLLFDNQGMEKKLIFQLPAPLSAKRGWCDDEDTMLMLSPKLADNNICLYGLSQSYLICKDNALGERRLERKKSHHHLMGGQIDTCLRQDTRQFIIVRTAPIAWQLPRIIE